MTALIYAALLLGYPFLASATTERFGVRVSAVALAAFAGLTLFGVRRASRLSDGAGRASRGALVALPILAALFDERTFLLLVPAGVYTLLALVFLDSLQQEVSLLERGVRWLHPWAPDFIRSYLRKLTLFWVGFFALNALGIAGLAVAAPVSTWEAYTRYGVYALMGLISLVEFVVRKAWFRYYFHNGPIDRTFAQFFPAEATEAGRRSSAYIRHMREQMAREAAESSS
ncbi:MAG: hypothetical protein O7A09_12130 [Proteobacteria bacterium]|nr:hypothetical protein [Pseudomonadota bacterium]